MSILLYNAGVQPMKEYQYTSDENMTISISLILDLPDTSFQRLLDAIIKEDMRRRQVNEILKPIAQITK